MENAHWIISVLRDLEGFASLNDLKQTESAVSKAILCAEIELQPKQGGVWSTKSSNQFH